MKKSKFTEVCSFTEIRTKGDGENERVCAATCCGPCAPKTDQSAATNRGRVSRESLPSQPKYFVQLNLKRDTTLVHCAAVETACAAICARLADAMLTGVQI